MDVTLALGGGGSRGFAHVGVLRRLIAEGFHVRAISGSSAGGVIAVLFAAGYSPDELETRLNEIDQSRLFGLGIHEGPALLGLTGAIKVLQDLLGERRFEDLIIPCALTSVDVHSASEIILREGRVLDAILATTALPGIFPPKESHELLLVDGAVLNPVPVSVARMLMPGLPVVAVILSSTPRHEIHLEQMPLPVPVPPRIVKRLVRTRIAQAFDIFLNSVDIGSRKLAELRLKEDNPEVILRPDVGDVGMLDTVEVHKIILKGEQAVNDMLPEIKRATSWSSRMRRKFIGA